MLDELTLTEVENSGNADALIYIQNHARDFKKMTEEQLLMLEKAIDKIDNDNPRFTVRDAARRTGLKFNLIYKMLKLKWELKKIKSVPILTENTQEKRKKYVTEQNTYHEV